MRHSLFSAGRGLALLLLLVGLSGCLHVFRRVDAHRIDPAKPPTNVASPVKLHLFDGSVVLFPAGANFTPEAVQGEGRRYGLGAGPDSTGVAVSSVPLDSVAALETYREGIRPVESLMATAASSVASAIGGAVLWVAIFGSCPTVYAPASDSLALEAELFSNSIVPLFELRDVDRLAFGPGPDGVLELEVRNEALETHYLNHVELVEVEHRPGALAVPGERGSAWILDPPAPAANVVDRAGQPAGAVLAAADGVAYETAPATLAGLTDEDLMDHIDLQFPSPGAGTAGLYLRLRSSLLTTVFLYDFLLAAQGAEALDWMGKELNSIGGAVRMGSFYRKRMGLRVQVRERGVYREVARIREVGPIAWDDIAVPVPVPPGDTLHVRLAFIADAWRIDQVGLSPRIERRDVRTLPVARVLDLDDAAAAGAMQGMAGPDEAYHVTTPGERFRIQFDTGAPDGRARSYFLAGQGYYTEWIRGSWVRENPSPEPLRVSDATLRAAIGRWLEVKDDFEHRFETSRIPVR